MNLKVLKAACIALLPVLVSCSGGVEGLLGAPQTPVSPEAKRKWMEQYNKNPIQPDRINRAECQRILTIGDENTADYQTCKAWW